jgi:Bacterial Ig-like domain (group 2)
MFDRSCVRVLLLAGIALSIAGCTNTSGLDSITVSPSSGASVAVGQSTQFTATGTLGNANHATSETLTTGVTWSSSTPAVATVNSAGVATGVSAGTTTITATATGYSGVVSSSSVLTVSGVGGAGGAGSLTALSIVPDTQAVSASGQTGQYIAIGTFSNGIQENVTGSSQLVWSSAIPSVATVNASGLVSGVSAGNSTIEALWTNTNNSVVVATAGVTVSLTTPPEPLLSLTIIPASITVGNIEGTGNFLAIGTFSTVPYVRDLTNSVTWISTAPNSFPVDTNATPANPGAPAGLVTAYGTGGAVIVAEATSSDGTIQTATATFNCPLVLPDPPITPGSCYPGSEASALLSTVTIYNEGLNTSNWLVTAPSATGTPNVIHCGPGSIGAGLGESVCVATYPTGTPLVLTAPAQSGVSFGGWSSNCTSISPNPSTAAGPNTCTLTPTTFNETVGAIFN